MNSTKSGNSTISESLHAAKGLGIVLVVLAIALGVSGSLACIAVAALIAGKSRFPAEAVVAPGMYSSCIYLLHTIFTGAAKVSWSRSAAA
jgi:hypothetical protein